MLLCDIIALNGVVMKLHDLINKKFGLWTTIERDWKNTKGIYWICKCDCGNIKSVRHDALKEGRSVSCGSKGSSGCKVKVLKINGIVGWNRISDRKEALYNKERSMYKGSAKIDNRSFNLTQIEFNSLVDKNCYYCGKAPSMIKKDKFSDIIIVVNGIDRIDSGLGYNIANCVACCSVCNFMKNDMSLGDFKSHIALLYSNLANF
jgi:hypothetical protein